ncbi:MAG: hypothetical protein MZV63_42855 [Marinilabiliales bacterium]|nr:hypothetical protein [Marinilabiliales bacterium]
MTEARVAELERKVEQMMQLNKDEVKFYVNTGDVYNQTYAPGTPEVRILLKSGTDKRHHCCLGPVRQGGAVREGDKILPLLSQRDIFEFKTIRDGIYCRNDSPVT